MPQSTSRVDRVDRVERALDALHERVRANPWAYRFALVNRALLAGAFLPTGMVKLLGRRFTTLPSDDPIGAFFEAMYQSGGYWRLIGAVQVVASVCLLVPRLATLGAVLFFPVILNIFAITVSLRFTGTPFVTGPMLLAALYLLCWDYHRLKGALFETPYAGAPVDERAPGYALAPIERAALGLGVAGLMGVTFAARGLAVGGAARVALLASLASVLVATLLALASLPATRRARRG